ncbi:hypothetical protein A6R68_04223 [Neotoma lepida]|uniref:Uncharacterized protein n=1 Tax=Neotoma lepida TaxID=56216 RepID=A0A1A6GPE6_NEOLE|nr:hypothetical protein A6R68_04223 [Neotoma lepida]
MVHGGWLRSPGEPPACQFCGVGISATPSPQDCGDRLHLRRTTEQHVPEVEVQVKRRRTASLSNQECHLYPHHSQQQQQQVPVVDF